uniref:Uncharacterized protein n=1 Tax=Moniliophthora roreri TaxID=221103 RepID=A0A0W0FMW2_MONRR
MGLIHNHILGHIFTNIFPGNSPVWNIDVGESSEWIRATTQVQQIGNLSPDYFEPIPGPQETPPASGCIVESPGIWYSIDIAIPDSPLEQCHALQVGSPAEDNHRQAKTLYSQIDDDVGGVGANEHV